MDPPPLPLPFFPSFLPPPPHPPPPSSFAPLPLLPNPTPVLVPPPPPPPAATDLPSAISLLHSLSSLAHSALLSLTSLHPTASSSSLIRCPFNPHHRMPPESLFRHSLVCSSAPPATGAADLLAGLRYPSTLPSNDRFQEERAGDAFVRPLGDDPDADLCFSLDAELRDLGSGFFYRDCPGVVSAAPEPDASSKTFSLSGFLSVECANFAVRVSDDESLDLGEPGGVAEPMLPSEYWALKLEVDALDGSQALYGYTVLRAASGVDLVQEEGLKGWVISNSPKFGILIDVAMREHIYLLLRLCLKAIGREARCSLRLTLNKDETLNPKSRSFQCPNFLRSSTWLASQLAILYGEMNGRLFALGMLKEALLQVGSMLFFNELGRNRIKESDGSDNGLDDRDSKFTGDSEIKYPLHDVSRRKVYVSQVAAAVAALHERSRLEERIRALRFSQPVSKYQIILEHSHASARASEERQKRPNYRPILEHDGLLWHRDQNQGLGKAKTREELLAEERDYKRRRMSYRGKKLKRNPSQVLRDIIDQHMEEIKQAGGIGCNVKVTAEGPIYTDDYSRQSDENNHNFKSSYFNNSDAKSCPPAYKKPSHADVSESDQSYVSHNLTYNQPKLRDGNYGHQDDHDRNRHERHNSRDSSDRSCLNERRAYQNGQYDMTAETKYDKRGCGYSSRSKEYTSRSSLTSRSGKDIHKERTRSYESDTSKSVTQRRFEDRYDPSGSNQEYDTYGDTKINTNQISEKTYSYIEDKYYDQQRRHDRSTRRHRKYHE